MDGTMPPYIHAAWAPVVLPATVCFIVLTSERSSLEGALNNASLALNTYVLWSYGSVLAEIISVESMQLRILMIKLREILQYLQKHEANFSWDHFYVYRTHHIEVIPYFHIFNQLFGRIFVIFIVSIFFVEYNEWLTGIGRFMLNPIK